LNASLLAGLPALRPGGHALGSTPNGCLNAAWTASFRGPPLRFVRA